MHWESQPFDIGDQLCNLYLFLSYGYVRIQPIREEQEERKTNEKSNKTNYI